MRTILLLLVALCYFMSCHAQTTSENKIPIDPQRWYELNTIDFSTTGLVGLFDGITDVRVNTGYGKIFDRYDSYYPLLDGEEISIEGIRMYDGEGSYESSPMILSVITADWQRFPIATFKGTSYNTWVGPDPAHPNQFALSSPVTNIKYLVITSTSYSYPNEIELYGTYQVAKAGSPAPQKNIKLNQTFGVNAFEWDFEAPQDPTIIHEDRMKAIKSFKGIRHYLDWEKLESTEGAYTFNPTHSGGWNYDAIYERCQKEGIEVLACIKTIPGWMMNTYPDSLKDTENVPVRYGKDFSDPASYTEQAKVGFQFAARYGANVNVDRSLLSVNSATRWTNDPANVVKVGLGLIRYIECDNERDKWWKGRKAYQTGREYAANLSAFYDGHKNTMGPGVGVKNADPSMQVVMGGLAGANVDYVKGMVDWCKEFRGYKADGTVNLCWDVINYHYYANDDQSSQSGSSSRGAAPEVSGSVSVAKRFLSVAHQFALDMPVWITEVGYDINQASPMKAIPIGDKSVLETQADWILRTALLYARNGIERVFFYQLYDNVPLNGDRFSTMGLCNPEDFSRRPAADYLYQTSKLMGEYFFKETLNADPIVDRYELNGNSAWVLVVPDEKGRTETYKLNTGTSTVRVFKPTIGSDSMTEQVIHTNNGIIELTVTETPLFVLPGENKTADTPANAGAIAGPATVCVSSSAEYSVTSVAGATGYAWSVPAGWEIKSGSNSNTITVVAGSTNGEVTVRPFNEAGYGAGSTVTVTSATIPVLSALSGPAEACENTIATYTTGSAAQTDYTWSVSGAGWGINSPNGTSTLKVLVGTGEGSITVVGTNTCGSSTAVMLRVKSNSAVVSVGVISGNNTVCEGSSQDFSIASVANASNYAWSVPSGWSIASGQGSTLVKVVIGSNSGKVAVVAGNACGNAATSKDVVASTSTVQITNNAGTSATRNVSSSCTYVVANNEFDAVATTSCGAVNSPNWQLSGATTGSGSGSLSGMTFNQGVTTVIWKAGSQNTQTIVRVSDATAPLINLPANIMQQLNGNKCSSPLLIPNPTITDNCTLVLITWEMTGATIGSSANSGINYVGKQNFNVGITYITYTAMDASGNESTAWFTVTLNNPRCSGDNPVWPNLKPEANLLSLKAYPNPSDNYFNIQISGTEDLMVDVRVIDMLGRVIEHRKSVKPGTVIQFGQNYRPGGYILEAIQGEERKHVKLVKGTQNL